jgi:hypothetical protein
VGRPSLKLSFQGEVASAPKHLEDVEDPVSDPGTKTRQNLRVAYI